MRRWWRGWPWPGLLLLAAIATVLLLDRLFPPDLGRWRDQGAMVVDRQGDLLRAFTTADDKWRFAVTAEEVEPRYLRALVAVEDKRFWHHPGVDPLALGRALGQLLWHGRVVSGGSTLTMQAARLLEPRPRTLGAKLIEMLRAFQLEARFGKREILSIYLALAPFGGNLEGVRAATLVWLGREPDALTTAETALLIALPQAPAALRPDRRPERARMARDRILHRLAAAGLLRGSELADALASPLPDRRRSMPMLAAHLGERLHREAPDRARLRTTLDRQLQANVERSLGTALRRLPEPVDVAALVVDHRTREARAYAGSGDYLGRRRAGMVDLVRALRSPGSTLKPFVYGAAFDELRAHPASLVRDEPTRFLDYAPENFDSGFTGDVSLREALRRSLNLPAVTLLERLGPRSFTGRMAEAGIVLDSGDAEPGLPLVLGGVGTTLWDLVGGYAALASGGLAAPLRLTVEPPAAAVVAETPHRLLGAVAAAQVTDILAEVPRPQSHAAAGRRLAFKTGTSFRFRDGWAIGYDARHVVGVWVGRADGASCRPCSGLGGAAPIMLQLFDLLPDASLPPPSPERIAADATPPRALERIRRSGDPSLDAGTLPGSLPAIAFPPDGAVLEQPAAGLLLTVEGGLRPFHWLVDGRPLGGASWRRSIRWQPDGSGFSRITVVDGRGRNAEARVRVAAAAGAQPTSR